MRTRSVLGCLFLLRLSLLISGCSAQGGSGPQDVSEPISGEQIQYAITEQSLPLQDESLQSLFGDDIQIAAGDPVFYEKNICRVVDIFDEEGSFTESCLQISAPPYDQWETYSSERIFPSQNQEQSAEYRISNLCPAGQGLFCMLHSGENGEDSLSLGRFKDNGILEICGAFPEASESYRFYIDSEGNAYTYQSYGETLSCMDESLQPQREMRVNGQLLGLTENSANGKIFGYGPDGTSAGVWDIAASDALLSGFEGISPHDFKAAFAPDGGLYLCDSQKVWRTDETPVELCSFLERDYVIDNLYDLSVSEDGEILLLVSLEDELCMLRLQESTDVVSEKKELTIALMFADAGLSKNIARFNRQNSQYRISVVLPMEDESREDYRRRIQLEISSGKGPDMVGSDVVLEKEAYIENGYFDQLEDVLTDQSVYVSSALDENRVDGKLYGIPFQCQLLIVAYPQELSGNRESWTMSELMEAVSASDAAILQSGASGEQIVYDFALSDKSDKTYIDWDKSESHLTEAPFIALLEFAQKYGDDGRKGNSASELLYLTDLQNLHYLDACFPDGYAALGYPGENGILIASDSLYLNSSCAERECAVAFLRYLMTEEAQNRSVDFSIRPGENSGGSVPLLPTNLASLKYLIEKEKENTEAITHTSRSGISYEEAPLTDQQGELLLRLLEHSRPYQYRTALSDIAYEELPAYFSGEKTAEETAEIMHSRVQIYLDEAFSSP